MEKLGDRTHECARTLCSMILCQNIIVSVSAIVTMALATIRVLGPAHPGTTAMISPPWRDDESTVQRAVLLPNSGNSYQSDGEVQIAKKFHPPY